MSDPAPPAHAAGPSPSFQRPTCDMLVARRAHPNSTAHALQCLRRRRASLDHSPSRGPFPPESLPVEAPTGATPTRRICIACRDQTACPHPQWPHSTLISPPQHPGHAHLAFPRSAHAPLRPLAPAVLSHPAGRQFLSHAHVAKMLCSQNTTERQVDGGKHQVHRKQRPQEGGKRGGREGGDGGSKEEKQGEV